jgi:hypothetical protein
MTSLLQPNFQQFLGEASIVSKKKKKKEENEEKRGREKFLQEYAVVFRPQILPLDQVHFESERHRCRKGPGQIKGNTIRKLQDNYMLKIKYLIQSRNTMAL